MSTKHMDFEPELPVAPPAAASIDADGEPLPRVVLHPDGYYWVALDGHQQFGPYESMHAAMAAMDGDAEGGGEPGETLPELQSQLGLTESIDPETGAPAERALPQLDDEH